MLLFVIDNGMLFTASANNLLKSHNTESKIDSGFVTFLIVNLKMFTTGEYYGLSKCIIAHNLD